MMVEIMTRRCNAWTARSLSLIPVIMALTLLSAGAHAIEVPQPKPGLWEQHVVRARHGDINQLAVAEVLARHLWSYPRRAGDTEVLARQLKDEVYGCPPVLVLIGRPQDSWLAAWSRADAAIAAPVDPAALAETAVALLRSGQPHLVG